MTQDFSQNEQDFKNSAQSQENGAQESKTQSQENSQNSNETHINPPFEKRMHFKQSLEGYEKLKEKSEGFASLHENYDKEDAINKAIDENAKAIADKEKEIAQKQSKLDEQNEQSPEFSTDDIDKNDPLKREKERLKELQDEARKLQEDKADNQRAIQDSISSMFAAKDIYDVMKNLLNIYRKMKKALFINKNIKSNDEKIKELDKQINDYIKRLNATLQTAGMIKEGKELAHELTRDLHSMQKESESEFKGLQKDFELYNELNLLLTQRKFTTNLNANTQDIEKLILKIQKESPNFNKTYPNQLKEAQNIITKHYEKEQANSQSYQRSA